MVHIDVDIACPSLIYTNETVECDIFVYGTNFTVDIDFGDGQGSGISTRNSISMSG